MSDQACPCGSARYTECCQPLHLGTAKAQTAEQLMRSRYSAFAKHEIDYLIQTTAMGQQPALDQVAIADWSQANQWLQLEIINVQDKVSKHHATVEFKAHYHDGKQQYIHHELSYFVQHAGVWFFIDPTLEQKISMKQPCICGSTKKFKQCCAEYV